jgi:HEAT repeat protein
MTMKERNQQESDSSFASRSGDAAKTQRYDPSVAFLLKELADEDTFALVCRALSNVDDEIAIGAALVLGRMKDMRSVPFLVRALLTTHHKRAEAIMWSLGELGDKRALPFLLTALQSDFVPKSAIIALGKIGSPDAADALFACLNSDDEAIRLLSVKAIGQIRFDSNDKIFSKARYAISTRLSNEASRRVKLLLAVVKSRLEKSIEHQI